MASLRHQRQTVRKVLIGPADRVSLSCEKASRQGGGIKLRGVLAGKMEGGGRGWIKRGKEWQLQ